MSLSRPDSPLQRPVLASVEGPDIAVELTTQEILRLSLTATAVVAGIGPSAFTVTTNGFLMPGNGLPVVVTVDSTAWTVPGAQVLVAGAGWFNVVSIPDAQTLGLQAILTSQLANLGQAIPANSLVTPVGPVGKDGATGPQGPAGTNTVTTVVGPPGQNGLPGAPGLSASTVTLAGFSMPGPGQSAQVPVQNAQWTSVNASVFVAGAGWFSVSSITDSTDFLLTALSSAQIASVGQPIPAGMLVSPSGPQGPQGVGGQGTGPAGVTGPVGPAGTPAFSPTTGAFAMPSIGATVSVPVSATAWTAPGAPVFVQGAGAFAVQSIPDSFHLNLTSLNVAQLVSPGALVPNGSLVTASGFPGQNGTPGATGAQGAPGQNTNLVATDAFLVPAGSDYAVTGTLLQSANGPLTNLNQSVVTVTARNNSAGGPVVWTKISPTPDLQLPPGTTGIVNMIFRPQDTSSFGGSNLYVAISATDPATGIAWPVGNYTVQVL